MSLGLGSTGADCATLLTPSGQPPVPSAPSQILPKRLFARDPSPLLLGRPYNLRSAVTEATWTDGWAS